MADRPSKTPRGLTRERIAAAAVRLADDAGLEAISMSRVADALGFTAMALYRHVDGKEELLQLMLDTVSPVPAELDEPGPDWRTAVEHWCRAQWDMLRAHAWIPQLPISGPPVTPNQLRWADRGLRALASTSLSERDKAAVVLLVSSHLLSTARMSADLGDRASSQAIATYSALLGDTVDPAQAPALRRAIDAGAYDYAPEIPEGARRLDYAFGLERILDGVQALIDRG